MLPKIALPTRLLPLMGLVCFAIMASAQSPWLTFQRSYEARVVFRAAREMPGAGILAAGTYLDTGSVERATLRVLSPEGQTMWETRLAQRGNTRFQDAIRLASGDLLAVGSSANPDGSERHLLLARFSDAGDTLWTREPALGEPAEGFAVLERSDGSLLIAGRASIPGELPDAFFASFSSAGNLIWVRYYGTMGLEEGLDLAALPGGDAVLAGSFFDGTKSKVYAVRANDSGTSQWIKSYSQGLEDFALAAEAYPDGRIVVAGAGRESSGNDQAILINLDGNGNVRRLNAFGGSHKDRWQDLVLLPNGDLLLAGRYGESATTTTAWSMRVDSLGDQIWQREDQAGTGSWESATALADGALLLGGTFGAQAALQRMGPDGILCGQVTDAAWSKIAEDEALLQWTPVPDASRYVVTWRGSDWTQDSIQETTASAFTLVNLNPMRWHDWSVRAWCGPDHFGLAAEDSLRLDLTNGLPAITQAPAWTMHPNPAQDWVELDGMTEPWFLLDVHGRVLQQGSAHQTRIDLRGLPAGLFRVVMPSANGPEQRALVKP